MEGFNSKDCIIIFIDFILLFVSQNLKKIRVFESALSCDNKSEDVLSSVITIYV